ncbi:hypothetical protein [Chitinophaga sp. CF418]|uniref:HYC_CC_PP family protein n=1 Tax=Chitinophaga sp. CF418 TaxID=1855287 RepID=UPI000910BC79|nr:hypothetical protein [Chitinophaga sp. CF418]SHN36157.1 hypothetical protein SAMN05216311_11064 [Chitinophaga sp. CF418]
MKRNTSIQRFKAALLLTVFLLNTVVGFACAVGLDMGFNPTHHHEHNETGGAQTKGSHHQADVNHHHHHHPQKKEKDNCCNDNVIKVIQTDKSRSPALDFSINPAFFIVFVSTFYNVDLWASSRAKVNSRYFVRSYHPPIPDIRIAIQSFQI